jgi:hypothetical protein
MPGAPRASIRTHHDGVAFINEQGRELDRMVFSRIASA